MLLVGLIAPLVLMVSVFRKINKAHRCYFIDRQSKDKAVCHELYSHPHPPSLPACNFLRLVDLFKKKNSALSFEKAFLCESEDRGAWAVLYNSNVRFRMYISLLMCVREINSRGTEVVCILFLLFSRSRLASLCSDINVGKK